MELIPITIFLISDIRIFSRELSAIDGAFLIRIEGRTLVFEAEGGRIH
jgi:DNA integrity scanning protein DisA with diadenylate cyclase activity